MKTVDFSGTIEACDPKVGSCRQLIDFMKVCENLRSMSFLYHIFPGFVCFFLYLAKISVERLQDHLSSGSCNDTVIYPTKKNRNSKIFPLSFPFNAKMLIVIKF